MDDLQVAASRLDSDIRMTRDNQLAKGPGPTRLSHHSHRACDPKSARTTPYLSKRAIDKR